MFRRKDESDNSASPESDVQVSMTMTPATNTVSAQESPSSVASSSVQAAPAASAHVSPYSPAQQPAQAAQAAQAAAARPATSAANTSSYRPAAMGNDFSRGATTARAAENPRMGASASPVAASSSNTPSFSALSDKNSQKTNRRVLTVGNDILLKGEIATCDRLVIEGRVEAKLSDVHTVEIAECGSFKGTAEVEDAEISGVFEGDLIVRNRLVIYSSGEVRGNITYGEIEIERGGRLTGQIKTVAVSAAVQALGKSATSASLTAQEVKVRAASKEFAA